MPRSMPRSLAVNDLVRGRLHRFSIDALVDLLARAGVRVHFTTERGASGGRVATWSLAV